MEEIIIVKYLDAKLKRLVKLLHNKKYFAIKENAKKYVAKIYTFIYTIPSLPMRYCTNNNYGKYYAICKMNANTTYYITYDFENEFYLVKNIFSNHEKEYALFIK